MIPKSLFNAARRSLASVADGKLHLYRILGVQPSATNQDIKDAFYRLSKLYHPDVTSDKLASEKFQEVARAYEVLSNVESRKQYDRGLGPKTRSTNQTRATEEFRTFRVRPEAEQSFASFYVNNYNKRIHEAWRNRSDPEEATPVQELESQRRNLMYALVMVFLIFPHISYRLWKWDFDPEELIYGAKQVESSPAH